MSGLPLLVVCSETPEMALDKLMGLFFLVYNNIDR